MRSAWTMALAICTVATATAQTSVQETKPGTWVYDDKAVFIRVRAQLPEGMAAFYEARGFPAAGLALVRSKCFVTVTIRNKTYPVFWLEPSRWQIMTNDKKVIKRYPLSFWKQEFDGAGVPLAQQAAFRWTQLPEQRDLRPDEPVGGNISLPPLTEDFTLHMTFDIGRDRQDKLELRFPNLHCAGRG